MKIMDQIISSSESNDTGIDEFEKLFSQEDLSTNNPKQIDFKFKLPLISASLFEIKESNYCTLLTVIISDLEVNQINFLNIFLLIIQT